MNIFLDQKYQYIKLMPIQVVRSQLKSIVRTPWYDLAVNLGGKIFENNSFKLYSKVAIEVKIFGIVQSLIIIQGRLESEVEEQTKIDIVIKPNNHVLIVFYLIMLIFIFQLYKSYNSNSTYDWMLAGGIFFGIVFIRSLIYFSIGQLKNRFEKIMMIHPEFE